MFIFGGFGGVGGGVVLGWATAAQNLVGMEHLDFIMGGGWMGVEGEAWGHVAGFHLCCCRPFKAKLQDEYERKDVESADVLVVCGVFFFQTRYAEMIKEGRVVRRVFCISRGSLRERADMELFNPSLYSLSCLFGFPEPVCCFLLRANAEQQVALIYFVLENLQR